MGGNDPDFKNEKGNKEAELQYLLSVYFENPINYVNFTGEKFKTS